MNVTKKPTRKDFLKILSELQKLVGQAHGFHGNDRDPNGFEKGQKVLDEAFSLCLAARSFDPPT